MAGTVERELRQIWRVTYKLGQRENHRDISAHSGEQAKAALLSKIPDAKIVSVAVAENQDSFSEMD